MYEKTQKALAVRLAQLLNRTAVLADLATACRHEALCVPPVRNRQRKTRRLEILREVNHIEKRDRAAAGGREHDRLSGSHGAEIDHTRRHVLAPLHRQNSAQSDAHSH